MAFVRSAAVGIGLSLAAVPAAELAIPAPVEAAPFAPQSADNPCVYELGASEGTWHVAKVAGVSFTALLAENGLTQSSTVHPGQPIDICLNGVDDTKAPTPPASQAPAAPAASPQCTYTVVAGDSEFSIAKKTGVTGKDLATENGYTVGQAKLFPGMLLDTCINGQPDAASSSPAIAPHTTIPTNPAAATAKDAASCESLGTYPVEVRAIPGFKVEPITGKPNQLFIDIDKSTHVLTGRLSLEGVVDYDFKKGVCAIDPKESGDVDVVFTSYVGVNQTNTPEGTFKLTAPYDTTCYKHKDGTRTCVLNEFKSLIGTSTDGKAMNGNIGIHEIPNAIPAGMTVADALKQIDTLPKIHNEAALKNAESTACIRAAKGVNTAIGMYYDTTTVTIHA